MTGGTIKQLVFDNHSSHTLIKQILLGHMVAKSTVPFWGQNEHKALPASSLVLFRFSAPYYKGDCIWALNGPMHLAKNLCGKFRGHKRTVYIGKYVVDTSACRDMHMPPSAYCGYDAQSDLQAAMFLNPWYLVSDMDDPHVPWCLRGTLLLNMIHALIHSAVLHRGLSVSQRLENVLVGHTLLNIGKMISLEIEDSNGMARGSAFIPGITKKNLEELCGFVAIQCCTLPGAFVWRPFSSTELPIEQFFGLVRSQFTSSQVGVRDYLYASSIVSRQFQAKIEKNTGDCLHPRTCGSAVTDAEFREIADRALLHSARLMAACSGHSESHLRKLYLACGHSTLLQDEVSSLLLIHLILFLFQSQKFDKFP